MSKGHIWGPKAFGEASVPSAGPRRRAAKQLELLVDKNGFYHHPISSTLPCRPANKLVRAALIMFREFNDLQLTFCVEFIITKNYGS